MRCVAVCAAVLSLLLAFSAHADPAVDDPFIWLEDVGGSRALHWVRAQNEFTIKTLKSDGDYAEAQADAEAILTAADRIPAAILAGGQIYNFWQDRGRVRGLWRRTSLASYQSSKPQWETLLDLDAFAARQNENWVWKGAQCLAPAYRRCLVKLSRGGRDAIVVREFDVPSRSFVKGGFNVAEAKTEVAWVDTNTVLVATNWGPETLTRSGYPRVVKVWRRGQTVRDAQTIYEGDATDVGVSPRTLFTPDMKTAIAAVATGKDTVYLSLLENVKGRLHEVSFDGAQWLWRRVPMPDNGAIDIAAANDGDGEVLLEFSNFVTPEQLYLMPRGGEPRVIKQLPPRFDAYAIDVKQYEAISADGTRIPYFLVRKEDTLNNGSTPTILYAYGGFQVSTTPWYWSTAGKLWLEKGGAYAVANVRGGGEFGPRWHEAAKGVNRQKNIDDLAAVARDMIARGFTSPRRLGVMGASQGGLLATATFIQNPNLFNAVVAQVPLTDMLRYPRLSAGASWLAEYGDPNDPVQRAAILRWSPYHNIQAGIKYPRAFFLASTRDDRVHPAHARKMAAKLQANGHPYLYFETTDGGHDAARTLRQRAEQLALTFTYFRQQLME